MNDEQFNKGVLLKKQMDYLKDLKSMSGLDIEDDKKCIKIHETTSDYKPQGHGIRIAPGSPSLTSGNDYKVDIPGLREVTESYLIQVAGLIDRHAEKLEKDFKAL